MANERENVVSHGGQPQQAGESVPASGGALEELVRRAQAGDPRAAAQLKRALARRGARQAAGGSAEHASPARTTVSNGDAERAPGDGSADGPASKSPNDRPLDAPTKAPTEELAAYGLSVDEFKDYCRHHTQRGWDGSQAAGIVDMILISRKVEKIPEGVRRRLKHALFNQGDQTLVMEEIGGAAVIGTRQDNAERRADAAAQMERETLGNMTGGFAGALLGGIQQEVTPDNRAKIHAASGVGALVDNMGAAREMSKGSEPRFEPPADLAIYQHGSPTHQEIESGPQSSVHSAPVEHPSLASEHGSDGDVKVAKPSNISAPAPKITESVDAFVSGDVPKAGPPRWKYIENPEVWAPARRALHDKLIAEAKQQAQAFAEPSSRDSNRRSTRCAATPLRARAERRNRIPHSRAP